MIRVCQSCGCSDSDACRVHGIPCCWIDLPSDDGGDRLICSACAPVEQLAASEAGRAWFELVASAAMDGEHKPFVPSTACAHDVAACCGSDEFGGRHDA